MEPERRRFPRKQIQKIAYIHLEPDNGAIVLNASEAGLAFHAAGPIEAQGTLDFHISVKGQERQKIRSEVVWVDRMRKTGGLRLLTLPQECAALREWLGEITGEPMRIVRTAAGAAVRRAPGASVEAMAAVPATLPQLGAPDRVATDGTASEGRASDGMALPALAPPPERVASETAASAVSTSAAPQTAAETLPAPLAEMDARQEPVARGAGEQTGREAKPAGPGESLARRSDESRRVAPRWGFAAMITLGMFCWIATAAYVEHVEFGGAAARHSQPLSTPLSNVQREEPPASVAQPAQPEEVAPPAQADSSAAMRELDADIAALEREYETDDAPPARRLESKAARERSSPRGVEERRGGSAVLPGAQFAAKPSLPVSESGLSALQPRALQLSPLVAGAAREPASLSGVPEGASAGSATADQPAAASSAAAEDAGGGSPKMGPQDVSDIDVSYFDVGRFRDEADAEATAARLAKNGFPATVVPKRLLWMRVFHVVVGPYKTGDAAETARAQLEPSGFRPRYTRAPPGKP